MTHYEERLERDLRSIKVRIAEVAQRIDEALSSATHAVLSLDRERAYQTMIGDLAINREIRKIDGLCHAFVARHLPSAGHLRFVSSVLRLSVALERVGDYAVAVSRQAAQLAAPPPGTLARDIEMISEQSRVMLNQAMQAFDEGNAEMARGTKGMARQLAVTSDIVYEDLLRAGEKGKRPIRDLFGFLIVFNRLARVGDQAENVCEQTLFAVMGETKQPRTYRILFLDERNDRVAPLARAYAQKAFPESGEYHSAGWNPAPGPSPALLSYMDARGFDLEQGQPEDLPASRQELATYKVIVGLQGKLHEHLAEVPFHSILLDWELEPTDDTVEGLTQLNQQLAVKIGELMEQLRGEEAS